MQESPIPDQALGITLPQLRVLGQSADTYIVADHPQGLCLLDQHAAHERVIYDKLQTAAKKGPARVQKMLLPITATLSSQQSDMAQEYGELLERYGFTLTPGENSQWTILTVPAVMINRAGSPEEMLTNLLDELAFETVTTEFETALAATMACHSAVRAGDQLTMEEMESIIQQLADTHDPHTCPHGRPTSLAVEKQPHRDGIPPALTPRTQEGQNSFKAEDMAQVRLPPTGQVSPTPPPPKYRIIRTPNGKLRLSKS